MNQTTMSDTLPALDVSDVSKTFGAVRVLDDFRLVVPQGEIHALLGENGSGKSTFIKILAGYHKPDAGAARSLGRQIDLGSSASAYAAGCRFVHQDLGLVPSLSVEDNLYLTTGFPTTLATVRRRRMRRNAVEDLGRLSVDIDPRTLVKDLSPSQRTSVALARSLRPDASSPASFVVFDEPTATLPEDEVEHLLALVRGVAAQGVGVLYVTHRLDEIFGFADRVTILRDGAIVTTRTVPEMSRHDVVNLLVGEEFDETREKAQEVHSSEDHVLEAESLSSGVLSGVSFRLSRGEILGFAGITGSGRESVLGTVFGDKSRAGSVTVDGTVVLPGRPDRSVRCGLAYLPPDRKTLGGMFELSARENIAITDVSRHWRFPALRRKKERAESRRWFEQLDVRPVTGVEKQLATFSGGNQQKVLIAKWLRMDPKVLLLDEPTQGVDVGAKATIYEHLIQAAAHGAAVVVSSSDNDELAALCHRVLVLRDGAVVSQLTGAAVTTKNISREALGSKQGTNSA